MFGKTLAENQMRREIRKRRPMAHVDMGFPHYRKDKCMCLDTCCHDENNGCICKTCKCRIDPEAHDNVTAFQYETQPKSNNLRSGKEGVQSR